MAENPNRSGTAVEMPRQTVRLHGDDDDHLRAVVILSSWIGDAASEESKRCRAASDNPWSQRLKAFEELLRSATAQHKGPIACIEDPDALETGWIDDRRRWDDAHFVRERSELLNVLMESSLLDGLFVLVRMQPQRRTDARLKRFDVPEANLPCLKQVEAFEQVGSSRVSSEYAPIAKWLLSEGVMDDVDVHDLSASYSERELMVAAWERFKPSTRRDAMRLCAVRGKMRRNGTMGPFLWATGDSKEASSVSSAGVDQLRAAGFLRASSSSDSELVMPRTIRHFVHRHASALSPENLKSIHGSLANRGTHKNSADEQIESHWHAIAAEDDSLALSTAYFYGADLRALAVRLGRSAHRIRRLDGAGKAKGLFERAASIFEKIVDVFDIEDAYAWEYAAYNRWQLHRHDPVSMPDTEREKVTKGFEEACRLDARNPLFRGRLLAYRAACGESIDSDFDIWMKDFLTTLGGRRSAMPDRLTWFVEPVLGSLKGQAKDQLRGRLIHRWPIISEVESKIEQHRRSDDDAVVGD